MIIDYALIQLTLWLENLRPIGLEQSIIIAGTLTVALSAPVLVLTTLPHVGPIIEVLSLPLVVAGTTLQLCLVPLVLIAGNLAIGFAQHVLAPSLVHFQALGWTIWRAFGGGR